MNLDKSDLIVCIRALIVYEGTFPEGSESKHLLGHLIKRFKKKLAEL